MTFQERSRLQDTRLLGKYFAFVLNTDPPGVSGALHDIHEPSVITVDLIAGLVEVMALSTQCFSERHEFLDPTVTVVSFAGGPVENKVPEVGQCSQSGVTD